MKDRRQMDLECHHLETIMTRKDDKEYQPGGEETTWSDTIWQRTAQVLGGGMPSPSPNYGTLGLPNDDDDD